MADVPVPFLESYLPYLLRRADQALSSAFYGVLNDYGIARSEWRVLAVLEELGELSILELTAASLSPQPTVTQAVRRLEQRSLVTRTRGTEDKRQRFVSITDTGSNLARSLIAEARRLEADALTDAGDLGHLVDALTELTSQVEARLQSDTDTAKDQAG